MNSDLRSSIRTAGAARRWLLRAARLCVLILATNRAAAQVPSPPTLEPYNPVPDEQADPAAVPESEESSLVIDEASLSRRARDDLRDLHSGVDAGLRIISDDEFRLETYFNPVDNQAALRRGEVILVLDRSESAMTEPVRERRRMEPIVAYIKSYFAAAREELRPASFFECQDCLTRDSVEASLQHVRSNSADVRELNSAYTDLDVTSSPTDAWTGLYLEGYSKPREELHTDGVLRGVSRGAYTVETRLEGYKEASNKINLVKNPGNLIECRLRADAEQGDSICRHRNPE